MKSNAGQSRLMRCVDAMATMELRIEQTLSFVSVEAAGHLEAPVAIERLSEMVRRHRQALQDHAASMAGEDGLSIPAALSIAFEVEAATTDVERSGSVAGMLRVIAQGMGHAAFGYAVLHAIAHHSYEIGAADLADLHRSEYVHAVQAVHKALGDVVVQELLEAGEECKCQCPVCSPGVCLCWHVHAEPGAEGVVPPLEGIVVRRPKAGSNAERAGLREGDVILQVDGQDVRSYQDMLNRMREHQPGEAALLRVRRPAGEVQEFTLVR